MHLRSRYILQAFRKRSRIFPILGLVGIRQVGKSTFLRQIWNKEVKGKYITFDREEPKTRASRSPEHFLLSETDNLEHTLIIDEAHKAPQIFDALKVLVDEKRRPGMFTLSGSVEFSEVGGVRETLTGRIGMMRLYPFTVREATAHPFATGWIDLKPPKVRCSPAQIELWLERGGMPGFCKLRNVDERGIVIEEFLNTICYRDLQQLKGATYEGALARRIIQVICRRPGVIASEIGKVVNAQARKIEKHLIALEHLFVLHRLNPHPHGVGKSRYYIFDAAVARYLGALREDVLHTFFINELLAQYQYSSLARPELFYYRSRHGSEIDLVIETNQKTLAVRIERDSSISNTSEIALRRFIEKDPSAQGIILTPVPEVGQVNKAIRIIPWLYVV